MTPCRSRGAPKDAKGRGQSAKTKSPNASERLYAPCSLLHTDSHSFTASL